MINELKRLARRDGIDWATVEHTAKELIQVAVEGARSDHAIRREVYQRTCPRGKEKLPFWKAIGQWNNPRYNGAFGGGADQNAISGWDILADSIACSFPELKINNDPGGDLYRLILSRPVHIPTRREALQQALEMICGETIAEIRDRHAAVPF